MQRNRFLVTGATGFIGRALSLELVRRGYDTRCAVRDRTRATELPGQVVEVGEIDRETDWDAALGGVTTVIHLAARVHVMGEAAGDSLAEFREINVLGTKQLARVAADKGVQRIVYVSSIGVNGRNTKFKPFTEAGIVAPSSSYAISKYEAEQSLLEMSDRTGIEVVILRPPLVYGPDNKGNFLRLLKLVQRGFPLPLGSVTNHRSMVYLGNLVDALIVCAQHSGAVGKTYLVSDGSDVSTPQLICRIARLLNKPAKLWSVPPALLRMAGRVTGKSPEVERLIESLVVDSSKIHHELGWSPPFSMEQGLAETVRWFKGKT
jgi:nucleoside-diphosphate-sugar epimerase